MSQRASIFVAAAIIAMVGSGQAGAEVSIESVEVINLGASAALAIDDDGNVVGVGVEVPQVSNTRMLPTPVRRAFRYDRFGTLSALGLLSGARVEATDIDVDRVVGWGFASNVNQARAITFESGFNIELLPTLGGATNRATAVKADTVAGYSETADGYIRAFRTNGLLDAQSGRPAVQDLGFLDDAVGHSWATSLTSSGVVAGSSLDVDGQTRAVVYEKNGAVRDLGDFGGGFSEATAISETRHVVGWARDGDGVLRAFRKRGDSPMVDLSEIASENVLASQALGVNDDGVVVGWFRNDRQQECAFVWIEGEGMIDLNDLLPRSSFGKFIRATDVNSNNEITAVTILSGNGPHEPRQRGVRLKLRIVPDLLGDLNHDGVVGYHDFALLLGQIGNAGGSGDLNGDGWVTTADMFILLGAWGTRADRGDSDEPADPGDAPALDELEIL